MAETKLDECFHNNQFIFVNYRLLYRLHITDKRGGLMVFIKSHIPSRRLNDFKIPSNIQTIPFEINLRKKNGYFHQFTRVHPTETNIFSGI